MQDPMSSGHSAKSSAYRRFIAAFAIAVVLLLVPAITASIYFGAPAYDLVRVGRLPARDFTPRIPQPVIQRVLPPAAGEPAQVLVLGDSFSRHNVWQSELTRLTGQRVVTWHYDTVRCTDDWLIQAVSGRLWPGARTIIVETVEREFFSRFGEQHGCARSFYQPLHQEEGPIGQLPGLTDIFPLDATHLLKTMRNHLELPEMHGRRRLGGAVMVDLVRRDLFSTRYSDRLLFTAEDDRKLLSWSEEKAASTVAHLADLRRGAAAAGVNLVFLVIPDKSSVYWPYIHEKQRAPYPDQGERLFAMLGDQLGPGYDLLRYLREQSLVVTDVYHPGDTHLGTTGYRLLAERVAEWLQPPQPR
ncbi:MAG: alginate O-acetyltransferase AlgX-related protein [Pseudomonadota bacterium]